jgi:hypothetical protein
VSKAFRRQAMFGQREGRPVVLLWDRNGDVGASLTTNEP